MAMIDNNEIAVMFRGVNKKFLLFRDDKKRLLYYFGKKSPYKEKWAVKNASFTIRKGESVALFGHNGAGKSTILKMIAGVAHPTSGMIRVNGRVSALLELSAGFDGSLTGRENIYYRAEILGIKKSDIQEKESDIVEFAELGDYIDQPLRTYSSGMCARLGFAINAHVKPEIIIVDEALSVGDAKFREKCKVKIQEILDNGVTFLFVTHSAFEAKRFCKRGIILQNGRVVCDSDVATAAKMYAEILNAKGKK